MIRAVGSVTISFFSQIGEISILLAETARNIFRRPFPKRNFFEQIVKIGWSSLPVTFFTAVSTGAILALQTGYAMMSMVKGTEHYVGGIVALSVVRELGPVLCAIMIAGRAGSGITAEIGTMKVTEQIDALITLSSNPVHYLIVPRVLAGIVVLPILTLFTDVVAILGGMAVAFFELGMNEMQYIDTTIDMVSMTDINVGVVKSVVFGVLITLIASFQGFRTQGGAEGVGKSTTRSVVLICMSILFFDYILSSVMTTGI
ncbi:MAG: ABC transporter permease [Spirochaetota bacterium]|jgi:phospholipid/cholesterol/gamma-HCH transport system permease protein|nr:ABC transporter permease [Spirochaetota bacterium]